MTPTTRPIAALRESLAEFETMLAEMEEGADVIKALVACRTALAKVEKALDDSDRPIRWLVATPAVSLYFRRRWLPAFNVVHLSTTRTVFLGVAGLCLQVHLPEGW